MLEFVQLLCLTFKTNSRVYFFPSLLTWHKTWNLFYSPTAPTDERVVHVYLLTTRQQPVRRAGR